MTPTPTRSVALSVFLIREEKEKVPATKSGGEKGVRTLCSAAEGGMTVLIGW